MGLPACLPAYAASIPSTLVKAALPFPAPCKRKTYYGVVATVRSALERALRRWMSEEEPTVLNLAGTNGQQQGGIQFPLAARRSKQSPLSYTFARELEPKFHNEGMVKACILWYYKCWRVVTANQDKIHRKAYRAHTFSTLSLPPVTAYRSMYRSRSAGAVCPLSDSVRCCSDVRLKI